MTEWVQLLNEPGCDNYGHSARSLRDTLCVKTPTSFVIMYLRARRRLFLSRPFDSRDTWK